MARAWRRTLHRVSGTTRVLQAAVAAVSADGRQALGLNYARMSLQIDFAHRISHFAWLDADRILIPPICSAGCSSSPSRWTGTISPRS